MLVISAGKIDSYKRELRNRRPIVLLFQKLLTIFIDKHPYHCKLHVYCASIYELDRHRNSACSYACSYTSQNRQLTTDSFVIRSLYLMVYSELSSVFIFNCPSLNGSRSQWSLSGGMQLFGPMNNK